MEFKQLPSAFLLMMASGCGTALAASNAPELFIMQQADKITVQGTVVDATGEPLIGVSVLELGTNEWCDYGYRRKILSVGGFRLKAGAFVYRL